MSLALAHRHTEPESRTGHAQEVEIETAEEAGYGNAAAQERLTPSGPLGRMFQRIAGQAVDFGRAELRRYLDTGLGFAEGEWFRGAKLDGAADALMARLDSDGDGRVSWLEFEAFQDTLLEALAPASAGGEDTEARARSRHGALDDGSAKGSRARDGVLSFGELKADALARQPEDAENRDLTAQLEARVLIDAVDTGERDRPVASRTLDAGEWSAAARELRPRR